MTTSADSFSRVACIVLLLSCPLLVPAGQFAGGTGEPNNPYQIATAQQLISIGSRLDLFGRHFILVNDIDLDPNLPGGRIFDTAVLATGLPLCATHSPAASTARATRSGTW